MSGLTLKTATLSIVLASAAATLLAGGRSTLAPPPTLPAAAAVAQEHLPFGPVAPPRALPHVSLTLDDGAATAFASTSGKWTLVQLMFANCATICPLQGAIFQEAQRKFAQAGLPAELLSISVDPARDNPRALKAWLDAFDAKPGWRAAVVSPEDLGALLDALNGRGRGLDIHDARVYLVDPDGHLAYVTEQLPDPSALARLIKSASKS